MGGNEERQFQEFLPETLIEQIEKGEKQAEQQLVSRYWRGLYYILNRRTNDPDLSADLAQDAFIVVINKARNGEINEPAALSGFIRQVGINLLIAHYRKESRRNTDSTPEIDIQVPDDSPDLYRKLNSERMLEQVKQLIEEMKVERDRKLLISYYLYEKDKQEICQELDLSPQHFDRVLHRARNRLRQLIEFNLGNESPGQQVAELLSIVVIVVMVGSSIVSVISKINFADPAISVGEAPVPSHLIVQIKNGHRINLGGGVNNSYHAPVESGSNG